MPYVAPSTVVAGQTYGAAAHNVIVNDVIDHESRIGAAESLIAPFSAAWTTWTPSYGNITVGNGSVTARYLKVGRFVIGAFYMTFGSTSAVSGDAYFTLPVTAQADATVGATVHMYNPTGTTAGWVLGGYECASSRIYLRALNATGTYVAYNNLSATVPGTWATNSQIRAQFYYEAAS